MVGNLQLAHQELSVIIDLINTVETNDSVIMASMTRPKPLPNEAMSNLVVSATTKLQCFRHLGKYFKQSAIALDRQVTREARFYDALISLSLIDLDVKAGAGKLNSSGEETFCQFFQEVGAIKADMKEITNLLHYLQCLNEESKSTYSDKIIRELRDWRESDLVAVLRKAKIIKTKLEALNQSNAIKLKASVVVDLMKDNKISKVKLFNADPDSLRALMDSGIQVMVGIPNEILATLSSSTDAFMDSGIQIPSKVAVSFLHPVVRFSLASEESGNAYDTG
ncbi:hypothetical protein ACFX2F_030272 [Malus domestica]